MLLQKSLFNWSFQFSLVQINHLDSPYVEYQLQLGINKSPLSLTWYTAPIKRQKRWKFCCWLSKLNTSYSSVMWKFYYLKLNQKIIFSTLTMVFSSLFHLTYLFLLICKKISKEYVKVFNEGWPVKKLSQIKN